MGRTWPISHSSMTMLLFPFSLKLLQGHTPDLLPSSTSTVTGVRIILVNYSLPQSAIAYLDQPDYCPLIALTSPLVFGQPQFCFQGFFYASSYAASTLQPVVASRNLTSLTTTRPLGVRTQKVNERVQHPSYHIQLFEPEVCLVASYSNTRVLLIYLAFPTGR